MCIARTAPADLDGIDSLGRARWPDSTIDGFGAHGPDMIGPDPAHPVLIAGDDGDAPIAAAEVALPCHHMEGRETSSAALLERIHVDQAHWDRDIARVLGRKTRLGGRERGIGKFVADALPGDQESHAFLTTVGFAEAERIFRFHTPIESEAA